MADQPGERLTNGERANIKACMMALDDSIFEHFRAQILDPINRILAAKDVEIWPDKTLDNWIVVRLMSERNRKFIDMISAHPGFVGCLHENQRKKRDEKFGQQFESPSCNTRFLEIKNPPVRREDQFVYAIAMAFSIAMKQDICDGQLIAFPFSYGVQRSIPNIKNVIRKIVENDLYLTEDPFGNVWLNYCNRVELRLLTKYRNMIVESLLNHEISSAKMRSILTQMNGVFSTAYLCILPDYMNDSWLVVYRRIQNNTQQVFMISPCPEFDEYYGLHPRQILQVDEMFEDQIKNASSIAEFPYVWFKPERRQDQFIYAIGIALCIAMDQMEIYEDLCIVPFACFQRYPIWSLRYVIVDIVRNGFPTNDKKGAIWIKNGMDHFEHSPECQDIIAKCMAKNVEMSTGGLNKESLRFFQIKTPSIDTKELMLRIHHLPNLMKFQPKPKFEQVALELCSLLHQVEYVNNSTRIYPFSCGVGLPIKTIKNVITQIILNGLPPNDRESVVWIDGNIGIALGLSDNEQDKIAMCMAKDNISEADRSIILELLKPFFTSKNVYILPDEINNSWLVAHRQNPNTPPSINIISPCPEFDCRNNSHSNQVQQLILALFSAEEMNIIYPTIKDKPEMRPDQFIHAIAIALCIAMEQVEVVEVEPNEPKFIFPFSCGSGLSVKKIKKLITQIVLNGLSAETHLGPY